MVVELGILLSRLLAVPDSLAVVVVDNFVVVVDILVVVVDNYVAVVDILVGVEVGILVGVEVGNHLHHLAVDIHAEQVEDNHQRVAEQDHLGLLQWSGMAELLLQLSFEQQHFLFLYLHTPK